VISLQTRNCDCERYEQSGREETNVQYTWDHFNEVDKDYDNQSGQRVAKYLVCNREERKFTKFCSINMFEMLNGKYGENSKRVHL
jgi:hypothetical protein